MPLSQDDKDEIRLLIAKEIKNVVNSAFSSVLNAPISITDLSYASSSQGQQESEARKKTVQEIRKSVLEAVDANLREADARIVEKTDPARAERIRKLVAEF
jgi:hypothetical protein